MLAACKDAEVLVMDGVMFMHHPRLAAIQAAIDTGVLGGKPTKVP